jgi:hypothetical protein
VTWIWVVCLDCLSSTCDWFLLRVDRVGVAHGLIDTEVEQ